MTTGVAPQFIANLKRTLAYWQAQAASRAPEALAETEAEWRNMVHAIGLGLNQPETWAEASELSLALHRSVDATGRWSEWRTLLETTLRLAPADAPAQVRRLRNFLGLSRVMAGDRDGGRATLQAVLAEAEADDDAFNQMQAHFGLAVSYEINTGARSVEAHATQALHYLEQAGGSELYRITLLEILGSAVRTRGEFEQALAYLSEVVAIRRRLGAALELGRALVHLGVVYWQQANYPASESAFREALGVLPPIGAESLHISTLLNLGGMLYQTEDYGAALAVFLQVDKEYLRQTGQVELLAHLHNNLASALNKLGRHAEAEPHIREAITLRESSADIANLGNAVGVLAEVLVAQGRVDEARPQFERALALLGSVSENSWVTSYRLKLAEAYAAMLEPTILTSEQRDTA